MVLRAQFASQVLVNGTQSLQIGILIEEVQEAQNKVFREQRLSYSREKSRFASIQDIIHTMLALSDLLIGPFTKACDTSPPVDNVFKL